MSISSSSVDWRMGPGEPFPDEFDPDTDTINGRRTDPVNGRPWSHYVTDTAPREKRQQR